ncbi:MAG: MoaD family protein [Candidatus Nezhaarchaeales archaeon]
MKVKYLATLKPLAKKPEDEIVVTGGGTLLDLLKEIKRKDSKVLIKRLLDPSSCNPQPDILILINGFEISALNGLNTKLKDGDTVVFLPSVHGG